MSVFNFSKANAGQAHSVDLRPLLNQPAEMRFSQAYDFYILSINNGFGTGNG